MSSFLFSLVYVHEKVKYCEIMSIATLKNNWEPIKCIVEMFDAALIIYCTSNILV